MSIEAHADLRAAPAQHPSGRVVVVDVARGLALCGMGLFHFDWDLAFLHWRETGPESSLAWIILGHVVAGAFLALSGFSLVLAEPKGTIAALRRLALLTGAALTITLVTRQLFPQDYIFFGILHCMAVTNLVALILLRMPVVPLLIGAAVAAAAPFVLASGWIDGPAWWWLGLGRSLPRTLDYRPVLPWLSCVLAGVAAARLCPGLPRGSPRSIVMRGLAWAGRHSLPLYLLHQPLLLGLLTLITLIHPPPPVNEAAAFMRECRAGCIASGAGAEGCEAACECVRVKLAPGPTSGDRPTLLHPPSREDLLDAGKTCLAIATPPAGDAGSRMSP